MTALPSMPPPWSPTSRACVVLAASRAPRTGSVRSWSASPSTGRMPPSSPPSRSPTTPCRALGGWPSEDTKAVGTGPFRLLTVQPGRLELVANPDYWGGAPRLRRVVLRRFPREEALIAALLAGEVDVTAALGPHRVDELRKRPEISLDSFTGLNVAFLSVNNDRAPWATRACVRPFHGPSTAGPGQPVPGGHGDSARGPLPPSLLGRPGPIRDLVLDRPGARRLLAEAELGEGFETTLLTVDSPRPYMPSPVALGEALREQLAAVGVRAKVTVVPSWSEYLERVTRGDYDLALLGWQADSTDPNDFLSALLSADAIGTTNRSRYRSPAMEALLKRARRESDAWPGRACTARPRSSSTRTCPSCPSTTRRSSRPTAHGARDDSGPYRPHPLRQDMEDGALIVAWRSSSRNRVLLPRMKRPLGIAALSVFSFVGAVLAGVAAISLAFPGSPLEPMWQLNPRGHQGFARMHGWAVPLLAGVSGMCGITGIGFGGGDAGAMRSPSQAYGYISSVTYSASCRVPSLEQSSAYRSWPPCSCT